MSTVKSESKSVISKASTTASTALDLLLQKGLQITPGGHCLRHPEVVMLSKDSGNGSINPCEKCSKEQHHLEDGSGKQEEGAAGNNNHEDEDTDIVSISRLAVSSVAGSLDDANSNKSVAGNCPGAAEDSSHDSDNMEALIARWCQLQDMNATSTPSDVLSTTLILLQLQKLERRVSTQEKSILNLENTVKQQQVAIRGDLTEILTFMATAANRSSRPARSYSTPVSSIARRSRRNEEEELDTSGPTQDSGMDTSGLDASAKSYNYQTHGRSQKSLLHTRDRQFHPSTAFPSARTIERQPPKPPRRHDSARSNTSITNSVPSVLNSVPSMTEMRRAESGDSAPNRWNNRRGRPPVMQSSLSNSTISTSTSSRSINLSHWQMPYGSTTVKSNAETTSTGLTASSTATPVSASATAPPTGKRAVPVAPPARPNLGQNPFKAKNSFRNKPAGSQLEIIWDASEHTAAQPSSTNTGDTTPQSLLVTDLAPPSRIGGLLGDKVPQNSLPTLVSNLDDDDEEESLFGQPSKLFSGMGTYMSKAATAAAGGTSAHHDSYMTMASGFSFMGDDSGDDDATDVLAGNSDNGKSADGKSEGRSEAPKSYASSEGPSENFTSTDGSASEDSDDSEDEKDKNSSKESKKDKKLRKKELKRLKKERKKAEKERKKQEKLEKKLSSEGQQDDGPDDRKPKGKARRFSTNILWKRGSKGSDKAKAAEQAFTSTEAMTSTEGENENSQSAEAEPVTKSKPVIEFSVVNDNPLPDAAEKKGRAEEKSPAMPSQPASPYNFVSDNPLSHSRPGESLTADEKSRREKSPMMPQRQISKPAMQSTRTMDSPSMEFGVVNHNAAVDIKVEPPEGCTTSSDDLPDLLPAGGISTAELPELKPVDFIPPQRDHHDETGDDYTTKTPMTARTPNFTTTKPVHEPPPPPNHGQNRMQQLWHHQRRVAAAANAARNNAFHPPSPPPRNRGPFPRAQQQLNMMPTVPGNSRREILIPQTGDSQRMQISTLTLDTALPSADYGTLLCEVTNQSLVDKINERGTYTGTINELDEPEGVGTMIYNNGAFYKGQWKEGHWHGEGILRTPNGDSYEGDFVYDCRHGRGIYKYENGDVYEGDFSSDKRHGKGTFLFQNGSMYRGDFAYGNFDGYGWYQFEEGYYEGSWVEGNYEGIGTLTYKDGSHYTGRFTGGLADGMGEELKVDGTVQRGVWKSGEYIGQQQEEPSGGQQSEQVTNSANAKS